MTDLAGEFRRLHPREGAARLLSRASGPTRAARLRSVTIDPLRHALGRPSVAPFARAPGDEGRRAALLERPAARLAYLVLFTPRSGSSRLTEILSQTRRLGRPGEVLNPALMPAIARSLQARDLEDYLALLRRRFNTRGVMGIEATSRHLRGAFGSTRRVRELLAPDALVWLLREDIVAQAVSISRMSQTGVSHARPDSDAGRLARAEAAFAYRPLQVAVALARLRRMECEAERAIRELGLAPLRLSYERSLAQAPLDLARRVAAHLGVALPGGGGVAPTHARLGTDKNLDFARRFRDEHPDLVARVERARAPLIEALD